MFYFLIGRTDAEAPAFGPPDTKRWLIGRDPDSGKDGRQKEKREAENEMVGQPHRLNGQEYEHPSGDGEGQEAWHAAVHEVTKSQSHTT